MQPTREEVKQWLKKIEKDRFWLAEQCGVTKVSVDGWFSRNNFPSKVLLIIQQLMGADLPSKEPPYDFPDIDTLGKITVTLPDDLQDLVYSEASRLNIKANVYCSLAVEWCATTEEGREAVEELLRQIQQAEEPSTAPSMAYDEAAGTLSKINTKPSIKLSAAEISHIVEQAAMEAVANNPPIIKKPARQPQETPGAKKKSPQ